MNKYKMRFNYHLRNCPEIPLLHNSHYRTTKLWWKPFYWLGNRSWLRYGIDKYLLGRKYWGGGGKVNWWCRNYLTYD